MNEINEEIKRLNFEDILWVVFIVISFLNIYGDKLQKDYLINNDDKVNKNANNIFIFTIIVSFFIYLYFLNRNYNFYLKASVEQKRLYEIKLFGSVFLIAGTLCLLYFQIKNTSSIGTPAV